MGVSCGDSRAEGHQLLSSDTPSPCSEQSSGWGGGGGGGISTQTLPVAGQGGEKAVERAPASATRGSPPLDLTGSAPGGTHASPWRLRRQGPPGAQAAKSLRRGGGGRRSRASRQSCASTGPGSVRPSHPTPPPWPQVGERDTEGGGCEAWTRQRSVWRAGSAQGGAGRLSLRGSSADPGPRPHSSRTAQPPGGAPEEGRCCPGGRGEGGLSPELRCGGPGPPEGPGDVGLLV